MKSQLIGFAIALLFTVPASGQDFGFGPVWPELNAQERSDVMAFGEDFKDFIGRAKSEMWFVREGVEFAESEGFRAWSGDLTSADLIPGSR